jgi:hypothetical protein
MNINENELVMFKNDKGDIIQSGGYKINSILKKYNTKNFSNTNSLTNDKSKNDKVSSIYDDLAIPAGLLYLQDMSKQLIDKNDIIKNMNDLNKNTINIKDDKNELIEDSLYDKLFKLASMPHNDTRGKTKSRIKNKNNNNNKTNKFNYKNNDKNNDKNKKTKRVRFSKYNKTKRFYK